MASTSGRTLTRETADVCIGVLQRLLKQKSCSTGETTAVKHLTQWLSQLDLSDSSDTDDTLDPSSRALIASFKYGRRGSGSRTANGPDGAYGSSPGSRNNIYLKRRLKEGQEKLIAELEKLTQWREFNVFNVRDLSDGLPLTTVATTLLDSLDLISKMAIDRKKLVNYLKAVEKEYNDNPYHNSTHAADVVQSLGCILINDGLLGGFEDLELFSMIMAAAVHDVGHPGVTNDFLIKTSAERAVEYNDLHVNEMMHASTAFKLYMQDGSDFLAHLPESRFKFFRRVVVHIVLNTDMEEHEQLVNDFKTYISLLGTDLSTWHTDKKRRAMAMCVHCADIANPAKPINFCTQWTDRVLKEFFAQGDKEKEKGLPVSAQCDREQVNCAKSQIAFLDRVVKPCYETLHLLAPKSANTALACIEEAKGHWEELYESGRGNNEIYPPSSGSEE